MSRYIKSFENDAAIQSAVDNGVLSKPYVAYDESANTIDWNSKAIDYRKMPLTFEALESGKIIYDKSGDHHLEYSINGGEWKTTSGQSETDIIEISVVEGDIIKFKGNNVRYASGDYSGANFGQTKIKFNMYGNIMSLIDDTNFYNLTTFQYQSAFNHLFQNCTGLTDASKLILPATVLTNYCYRWLFRNCTSLTTAPELPATTLVNGCYGEMFKGCTNLNYIKCLATDIPESNCTNNWVQNVQTTSGTFVKAVGMNDWTTGNNGIPTNWTVQDA